MTVAGVPDEFAFGAFGAAAAVVACAFVAVVFRPLTGFLAFVVFNVVVFRGGAVAIYFVTEKNREEVRF